MSTLAFLLGYTRSFGHLSLTRNKNEFSSTPFWTLAFLVSQVWTLQPGFHGEIRKVSCFAFVNLRFSYLLLLCIVTSSSSYAFFYIYLNAYIFMYLNAFLMHLHICTLIFLTAPFTQFWGHASRLEWVPNTFSSMHPEFSYCAFFVVLGSCLEIWVDS